MSDLENRAARFAQAMHHGQERKYGLGSYIQHPKAVADIVRGVPHTEEMLAAAWLHDVVEDCGASRDTLNRLFGEKVTVLVEWLTDVSKKSDGPRAIRKALDRDHLANAPAEAQTIKLADMIDNTASIVEHDPKFAKIYMAEKRDLVRVLYRGDKTLLNRANKIIDDYYG